MGRLHFFFPENDLALARNLEHYTAPPAAVDLRHAGVLMGLWYGERGDRVVHYGVNAAWYDRAATRFRLEAELFDGDVRALDPAPWGWSKASRYALAQLGVAPGSMPDDASLEQIRSLSHRRTASHLASALASALPFAIAPAAIECHSFAMVRSEVERLDACILKSPWSSSGRGLMAVNRNDIDGHRPAIEGIIARQGSVMLEARMDKAADFAMLFTMAGGKAVYEGLSLFTTAGLGIYTGNEITSEAELHRRIESLLPAGCLDAVGEVLPGILEDIIGTRYQGPLGVDMMAVRGADYSIAPAVELNLRMTMGHVCRRLYLKRLMPDSTATFTIEPAQQSGFDCAEVCDGRIAGGAVDLAPPVSKFSLILKVKK